MQAPESGDGLRVDQLEDTLLPVGPLDKTRAALLVLQQLEQELPEVSGRSLAGLALEGYPVGPDLLLSGLLLQLE